jgi:hypothetical protein
VTLTGGGIGGRRVLRAGDCEGGARLFIGNSRRCQRELQIELVRVPGNQLQAAAV